MTPLSAIEAMLEKCTPGEWTEGVDGTIIVKPAPLAKQRQIVIAEYCSGNRGDKALILNAPSLLRELIAKVRAMEKVVAAAQTVADAGAISVYSYTEPVNSCRKALAEYRALTTEKGEEIR